MRPTWIRKLGVATSGTAFLFSAMTFANGLKTFGYAVSSGSVLLLGIVAWRTAAQDPLLGACLVGGMLASIVGMILRWTSYQFEDKA